MKKPLVLSTLFVALAACNGSGNNRGDNDTANQAGMTNPSAIDTIKAGDGIINSNVISTDTAAINVQNSIDKANEAKKNK